MKLTGLKALVVTTRMPGVLRSLLGSGTCFPHWSGFPPLAWASPLHGVAQTWAQPTGSDDPWLLPLPAAYGSSLWKAS